MKIKSFVSNRDLGDEQGPRTEPNGYKHHPECTRDFPYCWCNTAMLEEIFDDHFDEYSEKDYE